MSNSARGETQRPVVGWLLLAGLVVFLPATPVSAQFEQWLCAEYCSCTGDRNGDLTVTVDEVIAAVNNALDGCPQFLWQAGCPPPFGTPDECPTTVEMCTTQQLGTPCDQPTATCCEPGSRCAGTWCGRPLVCATEPSQNCPISQRQYKRDIEYLATPDLDQLRAQLLAMKLARFRYKSETAADPSHLGFIIDDIEPSPSVASSGRTVDLYGYLSMAVATIQVQANDLRKLQHEVGTLREQFAQLQRTKASNKRIKRSARSVDTQASEARHAGKDKSSARPSLPTTAAPE